MNTAQNQILNYFMHGHSLTCLEALRKFRSTESRRIVSRLRQRGYGIGDKWIKTNTGKRIKRYYAIS